MTGPQASLGVCLLLLVTGVSCQNKPPIFSYDMNGENIPEITAVGDRVSRLQGSDPDGDSVTFGVMSDYFRVTDSTDGRVYLSLKLDYESLKKISLTVWISDGEETVERSISVNVQDDNDEWPVFSEETYEKTIREDAKEGSTVYANIEVNDADETGNAPITVRCLELDKPEVCETFSLSVDTSNTRQWKGHLILARSLTFEETPSGIWQVPLEATDGRNVEVRTVEVMVQDVQNQPPVFMNQLATVVSDNTQAGERILQLEAVDGDTENQREIRYALLENPGDLFEVDSVTGWITTRKTINREDEELSKGYVTVNVRAAEMYNATHVLTDSQSSTVRTIQISIEDSNDNGPVFEYDRYDVNIPEDVADQTPLPALSIKVTDDDQGSNAEFRLYLDDYDDIFEVNPTQGSGTVSASIYIKNSATIDFDKGRKSYRVPVIAEETKTDERRVSQTIVNVNIQDVNDNPPEFDQTSYTATISETATDGTSVTRIQATDIDSGRNGVAALRYKLTGNGANFFTVDSRTGLIRVAACCCPGERSCLDYERQTEYQLSFVCGDKSGEGFIVNVPLTIRILDENDNPPIFTLPNYLSYIREDEVNPDPKLEVEAEDADSSINGNNLITYSIVGGNSDGLWQIGRTNGLITATRPVDYESTPGNQGFYVLSVQATNGNYDTTGSVRIIVIDANDHAPEFVEASYQQSIKEDTPPGTSVETVRAIDEDSKDSPNGQVEYRIESGAQDKFVIDKDTGEITVAPGATFDRETQATYQLLVRGHDQGQPQKFARVTVTINILDSNNKSPYFQPSTLREQVYEDKLVDYEIITMEAIDTDLDADIKYALVEPTQGWDSKDQLITSSSLYRNLFKIDRNTGVVSINRPLSRKTVAKVSLTVQATDTQGGSGQQPQTGLATLIITILKVNDKGPVFGPPWTPDNPNIDITIEEELPPNSPVYTIIATDDTDLVTYKIIDDPGNHFNINPDTGVITIATPVDYETEQHVDVVVVAIDNGQPGQLTATATVRIDIDNINDENPTFTTTGTGLIEESIPENSPADFSVTRVTATDDDLGDYGRIRYVLEDPNQPDRFYIDENSGVIRVLPGAVLDREETPEITLTVTAYDSPNDETVRRYASIQVYITLTDENDNPPTFGQADYYVVISEEKPVHSSVVQLQASDLDADANDDLQYYKISGDPDNFFKVDGSTGLISTSSFPLVGYSGNYNLTVGVTDGQNTGNAFVRIVVLENNDGAPVWEIPESNNFTKKVLEDQYEGMEIIQVLAVDPEGQPVTYHFMHNGDIVQDTPEFHINPYTGVITAYIEFDREEEDTYILQLVALDNGNLQSTRALIIEIIDTDDNAPTFPTYEDCCTIPYRKSLMEDSPVGTTVGQVTATDPDMGNNAAITYHIVGGDPDGDFTIDTQSGVITTSKKLDHETKKLYTLQVQARNPLTPTIPSPDPKCRCKDPTTVTVYITILDNNDFKPEFTRAIFNACVPIDANIGRHVLTVDSIDPDTGTNEGINYTLTYPITAYNTRKDEDGVDIPDNTFLLDVESGALETNTLMSRYEDKYLAMGVTATDAGGLNNPAEIKVWVTEPTTEVKVTMKQPPDVINRDIDEVIRTISELTNWGVVCITDIRYHVTENGGVIIDWTDIFLQVIDGGTNRVIPPEVLIRIIRGNKGIMDALLIAGIEEAYGFWDGFVIDPVVAAIVIILILLLIALMLLCCVCCCLEAIFGDIYAGAYRRPVVLTGTINPLWQEKGKFYEDQELSMSMLSLETAGLAAMAFDGPDGMAKMAIAGGATTTRTETTKEYQSSYESRAQTQQGLANGTADGRIVSANDIRIETTLERPRRHASEGDYIDYRRAGNYGTDQSSRTIGTMTAADSAVRVETTQRGAYEASFGGAQYPPSRQGRQRIGATLTRSEGNIDRVGLSPAPTPAPIYHDDNQNYRASESNSYSYSTMPHSTVLSPAPPPSAGYQSQSMGRQEGWIEPLPADQGTYLGEIHLGTFRPPASPAPAYQQQPYSVSTIPQQQQPPPNQQYHESSTSYQQRQEYTETYNSLDGQLFTSIH